MNRLIFAAIALLLTAGIVKAETGSLSSQIFDFERKPLELLTEGVQTVGQTVGGLVGNDGKMRSSMELHPGKAMLLSAILPGMGEYYAGQKLKAATFFTVEVLAWAGVIYYYGQGIDKEDEFKVYADTHFEEEVYREVEYNLARHALVPETNPKEFTGTQDEWTNLEWDEKIQYLPREGFTHELPTQTERYQNWALDQQYYEMIGKYIHQFGFGWDDVYSGSPGNYFFDGDSANTHYYDNINGKAGLSAMYMDMRYDSNKFLDYSAWGYKIAILNHVASALDASFSVRMLKRQANAKLSFKQINYDGDMVPVGGLDIRW
ncbi:hypothetical protein ACFLQV_00455 [Calditrichota bacterium]